jgi:hypothetical protein
MDDRKEASPYGIVWAAVFLTVLIAWGLTIVIFAKGNGLAPIAIALMVGAVPAFVTVPLLLATGEARPATIAVGRVLVWSQALALLVACIIGIVVTVG